MGITAVQAAANVNNTPLVRLLLDAGADPNAGGDGMMGGPLLSAVTHAGARDVVNLLHEHGANVNKTSREGTTPLMAAARAGQADLIPVLLDWGADLHARRPFDDSHEGGWDVLMHAIRTGQTECAALLLDAGATINARDKKGRDALMLAALWRHADVVRLLLSRGADPTRQSDDGKTAWDWAQAPTIASRMAGKLGEKYGTTPDQVAETVKEEMTKEATKDVSSLRQEQAIVEALPAPTAMLTNFIQTMQNNTNERLRREAENQAEILILLEGSAAKIQ